MGLLTIFATAVLQLSPPPGVSSGTLLVFDSVTTCALEQDMRQLADHVRSGKDGEALFKQLSECDSVSNVGLVFLRVLDVEPFRVDENDPWLVAAEVLSPNGTLLYIALPKALFKPGR